MTISHNPFDENKQYAISGRVLNRLRSLALNLANFGKIHAHQTHRPPRYDIAKEIGEGCGLYTEEDWIEVWPEAPTDNDVSQLSVEQRKMLASIIADKQLWCFKEQYRWHRILHKYKQLGHSGGRSLATIEQGVAEQEHNIEMLHQIISILRLAKSEDIDDRRED